MTAPSATDDPLIRVRDAVARINMSRTWLYDALASGTVHGVRFGRSWRIPTSVVDQLARHGAAATDAI